MAQLDIFKDKEFQALDEPQRKKIIHNYFDKELADDSFAQLPQEKQNLIKDNFFLAQTDGSVDTTTKFAVNNDPIAPSVDEDGNVIQSKNKIDPIQDTTPSQTFGSVPVENVISEDTDTTKPIDAVVISKKDDKSLLQKSKELLFGDGTKYENPDADIISEVGKRTVNRTNELTSNAIQATYKLLDFFTTSPLEHLGLQTKDQKEFEKKKTQWFTKASDNLNNFIYEKNKMQINDAKKPTHDWSEVKKAFSSGGVFDIDSWQEVGNYAASEGVASIPDMAEMVGTMPLYFASRVQESAEKRAKNNNREKPNRNDYANVMPTIMGSVMLDRFGLKGITEDVVKQVGKTALDGTLKDTIKVIAKEAKHGVVVEGGTEGVQNPLEQFGEEQNTKHGLSSAGNYIDSAISGAVAGGIMGSAMSGATATGSEAFNSYTKEKQDAQREAFVQDAYNKQMLGSGLVATVDDNGYVAFKNSLDTKIKDIQSKFENLVINHPDIEIPVEAVDNVAVQEAVVKKAEDDGLNVSDNNGLNAIDKGFQELEGEIGIIDNVDKKENIKEKQPSIKKKLSARAEALKDASVVPIGRSEDATAEAVKKLMNQKELDSEIKSYNKEDIAEIEKEHLRNKYHPVEINRAYDFLSTATKKKESKQGSLAGLEPTGQNALFDTKASEQYITPSWAKDIVSDTTPYSDVIKSLTDAKNGNPSELSDRAMQALHKAGDPHLDKDVKRFDELSQRWDLNPMEEEELSELAKVLNNHLQGEEDGTLGQRESSTTKAETGAKQTQTEDNGALQNTAEQWIHKNRSEKESDRSVPDSKDDARLVFDTKKVYSTDGINHEYPHNTVAKTIQKDVAKYVAQLAKKLGYEFAVDNKGKKKTFNGVNKNLAPAGGSMSFELFKPNSDIGIYVNLNYDAGMSEDTNYDTYYLNGNILNGQLYRTINRKTGESGNNHFVNDSELTSNKFAKDIQSLVDSAIIKNDAKQGVNNETPRAVDTDSKDANRASDKSGVSTPKQSTLDTSTDTRSRKTVSTDDKRPAGSRGDGSDKTQLSNADERVDGLATTQTGKYNEQQSTHADTVLPKHDASSNDTKSYSLEGKAPVELTKGERKKFNKAALDIIKKPLEDITEADREILRHYTGEGGLDTVNENSINQHYTNYATVKAMYNALKKAGIVMDKSLEPAVGSGNFVGFNPDVSWDVVDIDKNNIEVTKRLYPQIKNFHAETFETFKGKNYDLIISNVPFASEQMLMREHAMTIKPAFKAIHNFYFAHAIDKVKDNGIIAFMTSTGTMDGTTTAKVLRKYLMDRGDLIGAFRLPEKSQAKNAHTDTMIDIIFIQKRPAGVESRQADVNNQFINIGSKNGHAMNEYFIAHPENLLGDEVVIGKDKTKMGKEGWIVKGEPKLENIKLSYEPYKKLKKSKKEENYFIDFEEATEYAKNNGYIFKIVDTIKPHSEINTDTFIYFDKEAKFQESDQEAMFGEILRGVNANKALHLNRIMTLTEDAVKQEDKNLLNTALKEIESYKEIYEKSPHNDLAFKKFMKNHRAEIKLKEYMSYFDKDFNPAPIYGEKTRFKDSGKLKIDEKSPLIDRALFYSNSDSIIDTSKGYEFLSAKEIEELEDKGIFTRSGANEVQLAFMYYAGNIYKKLEDLEVMKDSGVISKESYKNQYKKLKEIIPTQIPFKSIKVKGGESWLPQAIKSKLLKVQIGELIVNPEVFDGQYDQVELYNRYLNKKALAPKQKDESDSENIQRTMEAEDKLTKVLVPAVMHFIEKEGLSQMLTDEYNRQSNFYVRPAMTGILLRDMPKSFRGKPFKMQSHQAEGAEKIVFNKKGVLAFAPGGGKTITAVVAVKNLLDQGVMKKPLFVVPVNTIAQWEETIKELYPDASVFEFPKVKSGKNKGNAKEWTQLSKDEKEQMAFDLANNRYDFTIIGDTMFQKFGLPSEVLSDYVDDLVAQMIKAEDAEEDASKKKQKEIVSAENKRQALKNGLRAAYGGDVEFDFSKLGFDGLIADEVQYYKNIGMQGNDVKGGLGATVSIKYFSKSGKALTTKDIKEGEQPYSATLGSMRSYDFRFKSKYVSQHNNGNNVILLTGTPTPNKPLELYTLLQHLDENILQEYGIESSKDFVDTFYDIENYETTDSTGKIVKREGLASMKNLDWLSKILDRFVDYKGFEDMPDLPRPKQIDVQHYLKLSKAGEVIFGDVQHRLLQAIEDGKKVKSGQELSENVEIPLVAMGAGRSASIDLRLYDVGKKGKSQLSPDDLAKLIEEDEQTAENNKIEKTIELVSKQYKENSNSGQIIFLDRLTVKNPDGTTTSTHEEIRSKILSGGLFDDNEVVFVNGGGFVNPTTGKISKGSIKPDMLNKIMDMYNDGKIKVIIGNTSKLGVGVDLNKKTTDIYQLDIPFRPDEIEQRSNRGVRQGNENASVRVHQFFQLGTFDRRSYDIVIAKRGFNDIYGFTDNSDINIEDGVSSISNTNTTDPYQAIIDLESDPFERERLRKQRVIDNAVVDANNLRNIVEKLKSDIEIKKGSIKNYTNAISGIDENLKEKNLPKYENIKDADEKEQKLKKHIELLKERKEKYRNTIKEYENEIKETQAKLEAREQQQTDQIAETKFITDEFTHDGKNVAIDKIKDAYSEQQILESESKESDVSGNSTSFMRIPTITKKTVDAVTQLKQDSSNNLKKNTIKDTEVTNNYARKNGYDEAGANYIPCYSFSGLPKRPDGDVFYIGSKAISLPNIEDPMNADSIRVYLSDIIGNRLYDGKLKGKSALGVYRRNDSAIRVKNYSDVEVMAHEMAHYLDFFYNNPSKKAKDSFFRLAILKNKEEVKALSYTTDPKKSMSEGFAEFIRLYLTNYNVLESVAPNMLADFDVKLASDKVLKDKLNRLQEGMHQFYYQGSDVSLRGKQGGALNKTAKKIQRSQKEISRDIRQKVIDRLHTIKRIEAEIKGDVSGDALDSAYKSLQLVNGVSSILHSTMNFGVPTVKENGDITYSGKSLNDVFSPVTSAGSEKVKLFSDYLVAKRASELMEQGRENLITKDEINSGLMLEKKYPEFLNVFNEYQEFNNKMLDFYVDMNLITTSQRENFQEMNKNYVPFHRVIESIQNGGVGSVTIGKRLTGGTHSLGNIMENILDGLESNIKEALISRGKTKFYEMLEKSDMGGVYATKISSADKLVRSDLQQQASKVAQIMAELGVSVSKDGQILSGDIQSELIIDVNEIEQNLLDNPSALEFWTHGHPPVGDGSSYIDSAIINDKRVYFETKDAALVDAFTSFRGSQYNYVVQALMHIKNIMTWNITNNPLFYLTNFARDTLSAGVLSKNNFLPIYTSMRGMYHFITQSKVYKEFMASGAGYGTRRTSLGGESQAMEMLNVSRGFDVLSRVIGAMEYGADIFEYGTRVGDFELSQKAGKSNMQSAFEAREVSTDFAIKGSDRALSGFMATVPFMKAGIVGIDKTARRVFTISGEMKFSNVVKFKNQLGEIQKHKIKIYATGGMIVGFTLALWLQNRDDDRYKKLTRDEKLLYWHFFVGDKHIKIPRPYDIGFAFSAIPEIVADGVYKKHGKEAATDFIWSAKTMFSVGDVSGLFQPILEDMTNKNWTGAQIIPHYMQNLDDLSDQYFSTTPLLYKEVGKATGTSPIKVQHYVDGYLGLTAKMVEEATENMLWNKKEWGDRPFARDPLEFLTYRFHGKPVETRTKYTEKYYELMQKASAVKASYNKKKREAFIDKGKNVKEYMSSKENQAYFVLDTMLKKVNRTLTKIKVGVESITYDKRLSKSQKERMIKDAYDKKNEELKTITMQIESQLKKIQGEKDAK